VTFEVIDSLCALEQLREPWWDLYRRSPGASPFQSPQWLIPWTRHIFSGGEIRAIAIRENGALAAFAPLFLWGNGERIVSLLGAGISDYTGLLYTPGCERQAAEAVRHSLDRCHWDFVDFADLRPGCPLLEVFPSENCSVCPVLDLATHPDAMDRKHGTDLRRARNRLFKNFRVDFETPESLNDFSYVYERRWGAMEESTRAFHADAACELQRAGMLRLFLLRIDGAPAAAIYAFVWRSTLYCYLSAYDPALAKLSPGAILLEHAIEQARAEGLAAVDFLRRPEAYKYRWGARDRATLRIHVRRDAVLSKMHDQRAA